MAATRASTSRSKSTTKDVRPKSRPRGRPPKQGEVADRLLSVRLAPSDWALLEALVKQQRAALVEGGAMAEAAERVGAADVVRGLVRQAARASGLVTR